MITLLRCCVCCLILACVSGCGKNGSDPGTSEPATARPAKAEPAAPKAAEVPKTAPRPAAPVATPDSTPEPAASAPTPKPKPAAQPPQGKPEVSENLDKETDDLAKRLEGLRMAAGFINDERLTELIDQFDEKMDELNSLMFELSETEAGEDGPLRDEIKEKIVEIKLLNREINKLVSSLRNG